MLLRYALGGDRPSQTTHQTLSIDVAVKRLRAKIDNDFEPKLIQTVRGVGYMLEVPDGR